jgi:hypothetical protein
MKNLNKYSVPVELIVYGETEWDAVEYAQEALDRSDLLQQDGIVGVNSDIDEDGVEIYED